MIGKSSTLLTLFAAVALALGGCSEQLDISYGGIAPRFGPASVNGTDVLAGMFTASGHEVATRRILIASNLESADAIVWFPNDFSAPSDEVCQWFDAWLEEKPGRTLVYVGRGYDAAPKYLEQMLPRVPAPQQPAYRNLKGKIEARQLRRSTDGERRWGCEWFKIKPAAATETHALAGPWSQGVDSSRADVALTDRLVPEEKATTLLSVGDVPFAWRASQPDWDGSQLIAVDNGSFLLNVPLVSHQHRILAEKLIAEVGPGKRVIFLESGPGGPPVEPRSGSSALWRIFSAWPLGAILLQFAALGIIFCFARWPIFGRPRVPAKETTSDFGKHVEAVSQLMLRTRDRAYALRKLPNAVTATLNPNP